MKYLASLLLPSLLLVQTVPAPADDTVGPFRSSLTVDRSPVDRNAPMLKRIWRNARCVGKNWLIFNQYGTVCII